MSGCYLCTNKIPLTKEGVLSIYTNQSDILSDMKDIITTKGFDSKIRKGKLDLIFHDWHALQKTMDQLKDSLPLRKSTKVKCSLSLLHEEPSDYIPFSEMYMKIMNPRLVKIIQEKLFRSFLQPIVRAVDEEIYGYEFLLRPRSQLYDFNPGELFEFSRQSGMHSMLDSEARMNAIRTSSMMLDAGMKRFINFLPSSIYDPDFCLKSTFRAVEEYRIRPEDLVFEVVETEMIEDMNHLKRIFRYYQNAGVKVALDDLGAGYSTLDVMSELNPDFAKLDRNLIQDCHLDENKQKKIQVISQVAQNIGVTLLAEGIENEDEWAYLRTKVDLGQGYFFGKPAETPLKQYVK
ncbi:EAL domain-containing protein [Alteribacter keqinensis]|uniref:EAL domain-containing protein n=1 Tax=Alteribacter keqinensis TaxID=2483800 RepID=A0A3M7TZB0_9BACI|nr:EAL domain-containing protein [Alteribacter keqinensis]RNA70104.1 EAL domain-containing protein [Alteribacter keqinensis]